MSATEEKIRRLVEYIADKAIEGGTPLADSTNALKAVVDYLQVVCKFRKPEAEDSTASSFLDLAMPCMRSLVMAANRRFEVVQDDESPQRESEPSRGEQAGMDMLWLALKALSQRTLVAISDLFTLITVGFVFWLWLSVPKPDILQLFALGMFALFVLAANFIARGRRK